MNETKYSEELSSILQKKPSWIIRYGIGLILSSVLTTIILSQFIKSSLSFRAEITLQSNFQPNISVYEKNKETKTKSNFNLYEKIEGTLNISLTNSRKLNLNQEIYFKDIGAHGKISSFIDTTYKKDFAQIKLIVKPNDRDSYESLVKQAGIRSSVRISYHKSTLFNRLFNLKTAKSLAFH